MDDGFGEQIVEAAFVASIGASLVDFEQRLGLGAADRLIEDRSGGQNTRAPCRILRIKGPGEVNTTPCRRSFSGDDTVADNSECAGSFVAICDLKEFGLARN